MRKEPGMATKKLPAALRALVDEFAGRAVEELYGPGGVPSAGTLFTDIEDDGVDVGDAIARAMMQQAASRHAASSTATACSCGGPLDPQEDEPHPLTTRRGDIGWNEPAGHCPRCRRAFFPSEPGLGPAGG